MFVSECSVYVILDLSHLFKTVLSVSEHEVAVCRRCVENLRNSIGQAGTATLEVVDAN